jgi:hypothetical protein
MGMVHARMERPAGCDDVVLRSWTVDDAEWYAMTVTSDQLIQRLTSGSPTMTVEKVRAAIAELLTGPPRLRRSC